MLDIVCQYGDIPIAAFLHQPFVEALNIDIYRAPEASLEHFSGSQSRIAIELTGGKRLIGSVQRLA